MSSSSSFSSVSTSSCSLPSIPVQQKQQPWRSRAAKGVPYVDDIRSVVAVASPMGSMYRIFASGCQSILVNDAQARVMVGSMPIDWVRASVYMRRHDPLWSEMAVRWGMHVVQHCAVNSDGEV